MPDLATGSDLILVPTAAASALASAAAVGPCAHSPFLGTGECAQGPTAAALARPEERRAWPVHDVDHDAAWCVAEAEDGIGAPVVVGSASGRSPPVECNRLGCSERRAYHGFVPIGTDARQFR